MQCLVACLHGEALLRGTHLTLHGGAMCVDGQLEKHRRAMNQHGNASSKSPAELEGELAQLQAGRDELRTERDTLMKLISAEKVWSSGTTLAVWWLAFTI